MKKLKKIARILEFIAAVLGLIALINRFIFEKAAKIRTGKPKLKNFRWKYGNVKYTVSGSGKPLLLLHGIGIGAGMHEWDELIEPLSRRYCVYAPDLPGFGSSCRPEITYTSYLYISMINEFVTKVIGEKTFAAGSGDSAAFLCACAAFKPENFEKIMMISPSGAGIADMPATKLKARILPVLESSLVGTFIYNLLASRRNLERYFDEFADGGAQKQRVNRYYRSAHEGGPASRYPIAAYLSNYLYVNLKSMMGKTTLPIYIIWGSENALNPPSNSAGLKNTRDFGYSEYAGAKAYPHIAQKRKFVRDCAEFFG